MQMLQGGTLPETHLPSPAFSCADHNYTVLVMMEISERSRVLFAFIGSEADTREGT